MKNQNNFIVPCNKSLNENDAEKSVLMPMAPRPMRSARPQKSVGRVKSFRPQGVSMRVVKAVKKDRTV